jgi:CheY-like chemotaxis protein
MLPRIKTKVLVVNDNDVNLIIFEEMLRPLGYAVAIAKDGRQAIDACVADPPHIVLMDVQMPVMDGIQATREITSLQRVGKLPPFPIVATTANAFDEDREACLAAGMSAFLAKPVSCDILVATMESVLAGGSGAS